MEFHNYYEDGQKESRRKGSFGSYVATAVIFTLVGALLAACFLPGMRGVAADCNKTAYVEPTIKPSNDAPLPTATPDVQPQAETEPETVTENIPTQTYAMPELDGTAPVINDAANPFPDIIEQVSPGMVGIKGYTFVKELNASFSDVSGSGFIISSEGFIMTNSHVIEGCTAIGVLIQNEGKEVELEAQVVGFDKMTDIAVLKIDPGEMQLHAVKLGSSDALRVGEFVLAIGDPTGRQLSVTSTFGIVSAKGREINVEGRTNEYIQVDAALNPGNSGGALFNTKGEVVGVVSAKTNHAGYDESGEAMNAEGLGFALPMDKAIDIATQLISNGGVQRIGVGVSVVTLSALNAEAYGVPEGILVYTVTKDGPAHKAGIQINDIIIECEGQRTKDQDLFVDEIEKRTVGEELTLKIWRYGEEMEITVELGDLNKLGTELVGGEATLDWAEKMQGKTAGGEG